MEEENRKKTGIDGATLFSGSQWCNVLLRNVPVQKMAQLDYITVDASDLVEKTGETSSVQALAFNPCMSSSVGVKPRSNVSLGWEKLRLVQATCAIFEALWVISIFHFLSILNAFFFPSFGAFSEPSTGTFLLVDLSHLIFSRCRHIIFLQRAPNDNTNVANVTCLLPPNCNICNCNPDLLLVPQGHLQITPKNSQIVRIHFTSPHHKIPNSQLFFSFVFICFNIFFSGCCFFPPKLFWFIGWLNFIGLSNSVAICSMPSSGVLLAARPVQE